MSSRIHEPESLESPKSNRGCIAKHNKIIQTMAEVAQRRKEFIQPFNHTLNENPSENEDSFSHNRSTIESHSDPDRVASRVERVKRYIAKRSVYVGHGLELPYRKAGFIDRNTQCTRIQFASHNIELTLTDSGCQAQEWIRQQTGKKCIVGLDVEWRPSFVKGVENPVALVQLCTENSCLILQMLYVDFVPDGLVRFLKEPEVSLVGVGVGNDVKKLRRDHGLECNSKVIELTSLAAKKLQRNELKTMGLKGLALAVLGLELSKPKRISMSNWASRHLKQKQIEYACIDAFVSFAIDCRGNAQASPAGKVPSLLNFNPGKFHMSGKDNQNCLQTSETVLGFRILTLFM